MLKSAIETKTGLIYKDQLIWSKKKSSYSSEKIKRTVNNVEYLLWFVLDVSKSKFNMLTYSSKDKESIIGGGILNFKKTGVTEKSKKSLTKPYYRIFTHIKEQEIEGIIEANRHSDNEVYKISNEGHPAVMCGLLPIVPILMCTDEGDTVLDCFGGTNVVGRASILLNRKSVTTEIDKSYFNIGCKMIENACNDFSKEELKMINEIVYKKAA